jgi:hypothetical protein
MCRSGPELLCAGSRAVVLRSGTIMLCSGSLLLCAGPFLRCSGPVWNSRWSNGSSAAGCWRAPGRSCSAAGRTGSAEAEGLV